MHIYYDIEVLYPEKVAEFGKEAMFILDTLKSFLIQRFSVLEDEMNKEWEENEAIIMLIVPKEYGEQFQIGYAKFSEALTEKLKSCLSDEDYLYINTIMSNGIS